MESITLFDFVINNYLKYCCPDNILNLLLSKKTYVNETVPVRPLSSDLHNIDINEISKEINKSKIPTRTTRLVHSVLVSWASGCAGNGKQATTLTHFGSDERKGFRE